ncbi:hypothetical protein ACE1BM_03695 [Aeromonas jandaei]
MAIYVVRVATRTVNGDGCHEAVGLKRVHHISSTDRRHHRKIQTGELAAVMGPYVVVALVIVAVWLAIAFTRMPIAHDDSNNGLDLKGSFARLLAKRHFV